MSKTNLFTDFSKISAKEWKQKIQFDLNGADYNDSLVWESPEGIKVKPFYHADDAGTEMVSPTEASRDWKVGQSIYVSKATKANKDALDFLEKGIESLRFVIPKEDVRIAVLLENIPIEHILGV